MRNMYIIAILISTCEYLFMSDTQQIKITAPSALVNEIDQFVKKEHYTNRQDFILMAVRERISSLRERTTAQEAVA